MAPRLVQDQTPRSEPVRESGRYVKERRNRRSVSYSGLSNAASLQRGENYPDSREDRRRTRSRTPRTRESMANRELRHAFKKLENTVHDLSRTYNVFQRAIKNNGGRDTPLTWESAQKEYSNALDATLASINELPGKLRKSTRVSEARQDIQLAKSALTDTSLNMPRSRKTMQLLDLNMACVQRMLSDMMFDAFPVELPQTPSVRASTGRSRSSAGQLVDVVFYDASMKSSARTPYRDSKAQSMPESVKEGVEDSGEDSDADSVIVCPPTSPTAFETPVSFSVISTNDVNEQDVSKETCASGLRRSLLLLQGVAPLVSQDGITQAGALTPVPEESTPATTVQTMEATPDAFQGNMSLRGILQYLCSTKGMADSKAVETFSLCWRYIMTPCQRFALLREIYFSSAIDTGKGKKSDTAPGEEASQYHVLLSMVQWFRDWEHSADRETMTAVMDFVEEVADDIPSSFLVGMHPMVMTSLKGEQARKRRTQKGRERTNTARVNAVVKDVKREPRVLKKPMRNGLPYGAEAGDSSGKWLESVYEISPDEMWITYPKFEIAIALTLRAVKLFRAIEPEDILYDVMCSVGASADGNTDTSEFLRKRNEEHKTVVSEYDEYLDAVSRWGGYLVVSDMEPRIRVERFMFVLKLVRVGSFIYRFDVYQPLTYPC